MKLKTEIIENEDGKFLILSNDNLGRTLARGERWEEHFINLVEACVPADSVAIDIGANFGANTIVLANKAQIVIAFEPQRIVFQQLCGNCFLNGLANVLTFNIALGKEEGFLELEPVNYFNTGNFGDVRVGKGGEKVEVRTLDSFYASNVSFIKIDVQGCELDVLEGGAKTIGESRPVLFVEIEEPQLKHRGVTPAGLISYIKNLNYEVYLVNNNYPVDHICIPKEKSIKFPELPLVKL